MNTDSSQFITGREVTVPDMLNARDRRHAIQQELIRTHGATVISFTLNIPGPVKIFPLGEMTFEEGVRLIDSQLHAWKIPVLENRTNRAFPENELYVKNEEGISNLKLSDRLPTDQAWLSGINDITKDGVYFTYQEKYIGEKEIEGDLLMYDAYIEKEDLFGKTGEMKVIYTPRVSSAGNIVTEE